MFTFVNEEEVCMNGWKNCTNSYVFNELQFYDCRKTFIDCLYNKFNDENAIGNIILL